MKIIRFGWDMFDINGNYLAGCSCPTKHTSVFFPYGRRKEKIYFWKRTLWIFGKKIIGVRE